MHKSLVILPQKLLTWINFINYLGGLDTNLRFFISDSKEKYCASDQVILFKRSHNIYQAVIQRLINDSVMGNLSQKLPTQILSLIR